MSQEKKFRDEVVFAVTGRDADEGTESESMTREERIEHKKH